MGGFMRSVAVFLLASALLPAARAQAQKARVEEAKRHYEEGTTAFNLGDYQTAITEYKAAYKLRPEPVLLYNIGQSCRLANDLQQAVFFYRAYLRNATNAPNRHEVEERISRLEEQIALQRSPPNNQLPIGGASPPQDPGRAPPPAESAPAAPAAAAASTNATGPLVVAPTPAGRAKTTPVYKKWWLWTAVGAVAAAGVGVGVGVAMTQSQLPSTHFGPATVFTLTLR